MKLSKEEQLKYENSLNTESDFGLTYPFDENYSPRCGLSRDEWEIEKVVNAIRTKGVGTLEAIGIVNHFIVNILKLKTLERTKDDFKTFHNFEGSNSKGGLNLKDLERRLDEALAKETAESLNEWLDSRTQLDNEADTLTDDDNHLIQKLTNDNFIELLDNKQKII